MSSKTKPLYAEVVAGVRRKMIVKNPISGLTNELLEEAYGQEVSLFLHCHLRGYDRSGQGFHGDTEYYDKYGAPVGMQNSWQEGYHDIEKRLADHFNTVVDHHLKFPVVAGMGGGVHIYKPLHCNKENKEPWNWTGWIPRPKIWLYQGHFFTNRCFLGLRGNEIQNNLWDYHPHEELEGENLQVDELMYSQIEPNDRYRGGYWFQNEPFGRYLHIFSLKSHENDPKTNTSSMRYNYIVHPLVYRAAIDTIPDNSVDAMQWAIINMPNETHFGEGKPWGEKCHGLEIFNDFTYFYSYQPLQKDGPHNGGLCRDDDRYYYFWYDTYPIEFAVFLLDSALARGVYFHTMCANDAFYERSIGGGEGLSKLFKYEHTAPITRQPNKEWMCYDLTNEMELKFTFLKCSDDMAHLIWRYTIMCKTTGNNLETSHGYFKLNQDYQTVLDLKNSYTLADVKWIYFTAISPTNPQHRAWFHAIRGPAFGKPSQANLLKLKHNVVKTCVSEINTTGVVTVTPVDTIQVTEVEKGDLDFILEKVPNVNDIYVYFMQAHSHQQDFSELKMNKKIKESSRRIPPRYLQSVHGYFPCRDDHPTRINLSASWDKKTIKDNKVYFYHIDANTGEPYPLEKGCEPKPFSNKTCTIS